MRAEGSPAKLRPGGQSYSASPKLDSSFIGAIGRGVAPKDELPENPAPWAGLGKRPGALPLKIVIQIRKIALVSAY
ncbi:MAG: hypothetical protein QGF00_27535, partial [Planctomycetota bacterium]|jgi:hypothetical protein|nr:hypothetical protein [Planctomycetota bacterium]